MADIQGHGAPTNMLVGVTGDTYTDLDTGTVYTCTMAYVSTGSPDDEVYYKWTPKKKVVSGGGSAAKPEQEKSVTIIENGTTEVIPDSNYVLKKVTVDVDVPAEEPILQDKTFTENGSYTADEGYDGFGDIIINVGSSGGGEDYLEASLNKTLTEYSNDTLTSLPDYAFYGCTELTCVSFPACESIGMMAFQACFSLSTISFPNCTIIGASAFNNCSKLTSIYFPSVTSVSESCFYSCSRLIDINFPECGTIGSYAFYSCSKLVGVNLPKCVRISASAFAKCVSLNIVSLPKCKYMESRVFSSCSSLSALYLLASSVCTLSNSNAFTGTPIASGTGSIYVLASLVDAYKSATNWTYYSNVIYSYEETT